MLSGTTEPPLADASLPLTEEANPLLLLSDPVLPVEALVQDALPAETDMEPASLALEVMLPEKLDPLALTASEPPGVLPLGDALPLSAETLPDDVPLLLPNDGLDGPLKDEPLEEPAKA